MVRRQHKEVQRGAEPYLWDTFQARPSPSPRASSNLTLTLTLTRNLALPLGHFPGPLTRISSNNTQWIIDSLGHFCMDGKDIDSDEHFYKSNFCVSTVYG